jgi:hypothetical protein
MSSCGCAGNAYNFGSEIRFTVVFTSALTGLPEDPTGINLGIQYVNNPAVIYTYAAAQVQKDSTGNYHFDWTPPNDGSYNYCWQGTGPGIAATANIPFTVSANMFG